jgi:hypothetical protein
MLSLLLKSQLAHGVPNMTEEGLVMFLADCENVLGSRSPMLFGGNIHAI